MSETYEDLLFDVKNGVALITLNRPEKLNAWTPEMGTSLRRAVTQSAKDEGVRVIVVTGAGRGLCAGADMERLRKIQQSERGRSAALAADPEPAPAALPGLDVSPHYGGRFGYLFAVPKPLIAAMIGLRIDMRYE